MNWYDLFNGVEALLWAVVAGTIALRAVPASPGQRWSVCLAVFAFLVFGLTDLLEIGSAGSFPLWLWGLKILCGTSLLVARYQWIGWHRFRWTDREFLFGLGCLAAVVLLILLQHWLQPAPRVMVN